MTNMTGTSISFEFERIEAMNTFFRKVYHWMTAGLIMMAMRISHFAHMGYS